MSKDILFLLIWIASRLASCLKNKKCPIYQQVPNYCIQKKSPEKIWDFIKSQSNSIIILDYDNMLLHLVFFFIICNFIFSNFQHSFSFLTFIISYKRPSTHECTNIMVQVAYNLSHFDQS